MANPLRWARVTVVGVFLLGLVVVVGPALWNADSLFRDPFVGAEERRTVETFDADGTVTGREVTKLAQAVVALADDLEGLRRQQGQ